MSNYFIKISFNPISLYNILSEQIDKDMKLCELFYHNFRVYDKNFIAPSCLLPFDIASKLIEINEIDTWSDEDHFFKKCMVSEHILCWKLWIFIEYLSAFHQRVSNADFLNVDPLSLVTLNIKKHQRIRKQVYEAICTHYVFQKALEKIISTSKNEGSFLGNIVGRLSPSEIYLSAEEDIKNWCIFLKEIPLSLLSEIHDNLDI